MTRANVAASPFDATVLAAADTVQHEIRRAMDVADVIVTPTNPIPAPRIDQTMITFSGTDVWVMSLMPTLTFVHNLTGAPAVTVPCGFAASGLPIGFQIAGRLFDEATVLRVAYAYERATTWHRQRPTL